MPSKTFQRVKTKSYELKQKRITAYSCISKEVIYIREKYQELPPLKLT